MTYEAIAALSAAGVGSALYITGRVWLARTRTEVPCDCLPCQERRRGPVLLAPGEEAVSPRLPTLYVIARDYRTARQYMDQLSVPGRLWRYVDDKRQLQGLLRPEVVIVDGWTAPELAPYLILTQARITHATYDEHKDQR